MSRFPSSLPSDIVLDILSYVDQRDYVECMHVSRQWYSEIPLYGLDTWKQLTISKSFSKTNKCMNNCLILHLKDVFIEELDAVPILKRLKYIGCTLNSIDIKWHWLPVQAIEDNMAADIVLFSTICQFRDTLKELSITSHPSNVLLSQLICNLPNLTHLTVLFGRSSRSFGLSSSTEDDDGLMDRTSNLVYLHLDSVLSFDRRIIPILRRCPKLTTLHLSHDNYIQSLVPTNLEMIFELCPCLRHFAWDETNVGRTSRIKALPQDENGGGIRDFCFRGGVNDMDKIVPILAKSRHVLERLELFNESYTTAAGWNALTHLEFPQLKWLHLGKLHIAPDEWAPFFARRPNLNNLRYFPTDTDVPRMDDFVKAISSLKNLEYLMIFDQNGLCTGQRTNVWSNPWILSCNTNLRHLDLAYVYLSDDVLLDLCTIRSLKELVLYPNRDSKITRKGLCAFANRLNDLGSNLDYLVLGHVKNMDDTVLEQLAQVKKLAFLKLCGIDKITKAGLQSFVQTTSNRNKKKVYTEYCRLIKPAGFWTDQ
ncbi:hypothetical protein BJV82DRAFT_630813 [Fennellomyces sp. T-0311]|nr:hypothetical protein BJV82DRAFT_630813 [Fennellomyces sp. T-0311]